MSASENTGLPAFPPNKVVDTTAAGDCFTGALAVALGEGQPLEDAVKFANAAASLSVETKGAQPSLPNRLAVNKRLMGGVEFLPIRTPSRSFLAPSPVREGAGDTSQTCAFW